MFGVKGVAKALREAVQMGGRITDESAEWLDNFLDEGIDQIQAEAREFVETAEKLIQSQLAEALENIDALTERLNKLEEPAPPLVAKKAEVKK